MIFSSSVEPDAEVGVAAFLNYYRPGQSSESAELSASPVVSVRLFILAMTAAIGFVIFKRSLFFFIK